MRRMGEYQNKKDSEPDEAGGQNWQRENSKSGPVRRPEKER
jgi:hypothetical protein